MPSEALVAVAFRIINFVIVVFGAWWVFRKYFASTLSDSITQKELHIISLQEQAVALRREQSVMDERISQDKKYAETLDRKIEQWHDYVQQQQEQQDKRDELLIVVMEKKHREQEARIKEQWLYAQLFPKSLKMVEDQLKKEYALEEQQEQFVNAIIKTIKHR